MEKPKKEITLETIAEQMEKGFAETRAGFADMGEAFNDLADRQDTLTDTVKGVQTHVGLLENQVFDLRVEVQSIKRIVKPYDAVHKVLAKDISDLTKRVRVLESTKR